MAARRFKVVPASEVGYGPDSGWIVRQWDPRVQVWFDVGDPVPTRAEADARLAREEAPESREG